MFLFLRTVAAEVRKQVSREYGSPQLAKRRGISNPVSHLMFDLQEVYANMDLMCSFRMGLDNKAVA